MSDRQLIDELYLEEVVRARAMTIEEKLSAGPRLFEMACQTTLAGIRAQHPGISDEAALAELRDRLQWRRRSEWNGRAPGYLGDD